MVCPFDLLCLAKKDADLGQGPPPTVTALLARCTGSDVARLASTTNRAAGQCAESMRRPGQLLRRGYV